MKKNPLGRKVLLASRRSASTHPSNSWLTPLGPFLDNAFMSNKIIIERLEFQGHCGVTPEERRRSQPLAIDLELDCETTVATGSDRLGDTVDYAEVVKQIVALGTEESTALLESFAERLLTKLFEDFPVERAKLWLRKLAPPLTQVMGSVGIKVERSRLTHTVLQSDQPSRFVAQQLARLPKGRVLDVACGSGRHALFLAGQGYQVEAIDRDEERLAALAATAKQRHLHNLAVKPVDLERITEERPEFPPHFYDAIVVCFYLHRPLFPWLVEALKPNGVLLYETFSIDNYFRHHHPKRWEFCLAHNELLRLTSTLRVLFYDEGEHEGGHGGGSAFTARLLAQKAGVATAQGTL